LVLVWGSIRDYLIIANSDPDPPGAGKNTWQAAPQAAMSAKAAFLALTTGRATHMPREQLRWGAWPPTTVF